MMLDIKYFGKIVAITNCESEGIQIEGKMTLGEFKAELQSKYAAMKNESYQIAVNKELRGDEFILDEACEIAVLPPFAGG